MFNRYRAPTDVRTEYVPYEKTVNVKETTVVNEHRAPTDDSIRLAKEYEEKIFEKVVATVKTSPNIVNGAFVIFNDAMNATKNVIFKYTLNGRTKELTVVIDEFQLKKFEHFDQKIKYFHEEVKKAIIQDLAAAIYDDVLYTDSMKVLEAFNR